MKLLSAIVLLLASNLSFAGQLNLAMTCTGKHKLNHNAYTIQVFENAKIKGLGVVFVKVSGVRDPFVHEASLTKNDDYISFDLESDRNELEMGADITFGHALTVYGVKISSNNKQIDEIAFNCTKH
ncbi:MAG: hypothetical protein AB7I27_13340 [Bacteriovoracaceae bacterium]